MSLRLDGPVTIAIYKSGHLWVTKEPQSQVYHHGALPLITTASLADAFELLLEISTHVEGKGTFLTERLGLDELNLDDVVAIGTRLAADGVAV